ncbi:DEAD/DEAH box helicase [Myxococcota bacterium]|nr:DEAD/DEAH box helicase [Myxococcota bacterium]MBU1898532.1 DEAD/DEAH box helicase [Myxococcota bacterium]
MRLPIDDLRPAFLDALARGPVVLSAPTGSGKSTRAPRWTPTPTLVVEPRRVACRALAARVAQERGVALGQEVGYRVRDEDRSHRTRTEILFVTPGVALRMLAEDDLAGFKAVILDEFHERSLETDLLYALIQARVAAHKVVMSATMEGARVAARMGGAHLEGEGRLYDVETRYLPNGALLPEAKGLERRVAAALERAADDPGDVLVFLPGKAEIAAVAATLRGPFEIIPLHGGLSLDEQAHAWHSSSRRKVILSTNVAETSLTVPGIGVVIDAGLVRRTRYHGGRGFLALAAIAEDSAAQRAGRAGRTGPGVCYRLWSPEAKLHPHTPPEIDRESLVPLVLSARACHATISALPFLDPPKPHAVEAAEAELAALGALEGPGLSPRGRSLFGLPLDPPLGRLLIEAEGGAALDDVIDLVAALAVGRPLFERERPHDERDDLRASGCDATALIRAVREGSPAQHRLRAFALSEARRVAARLRRAFARPPSTARPDQARLAQVALAADPRCAYVARRRKRHVAWSNGGTEVRLSHDCALAPLLEGPEGEKIEAALVFETRAFGVNLRENEIRVTCAMPAPLRWLREAGVGRQRVASVTLRHGRMVAEIEQVHARKVLGRREAEPEGALARQALLRCLLDGRLWPASVALSRERLEAASLHARLSGAAAPPPLEDWLEAQIEALGFEVGADLMLLEGADFEAPDLPSEVRARLDRAYPRRLSLGDATYAVEYALAQATVTLVKVSGQRRAPPPLSWLPSFEGLRILVRDKNVVRELRAGR